MAEPKMTADQKRWQAQDDAMALKRFAELQSNQQRLKAAKSIISTEIKQAQKALGQTPKKSPPAKKQTKPAKPIKK
jgi:hypothetical protein